MGRPGRGQVGRVGAGRGGSLLDVRPATRAHWGRQGGPHRPFPRRSCRPGSPGVPGCPHSGLSGTVPVVPPWLCGTCLSAGRRPHSRPRAWGAWQGLCGGVRSRGAAPPPAHLLYPLPALAPSPHARLARRPLPAGRLPDAAGALSGLFPGLGGRPWPALLCCPVHRASPQRAGPAGRERVWPAPLTGSLLCPQCKRSLSRCRWRAAPASSSVATSWPCPPASSARSGTAATPSSTRRATLARSWSWWQVRPRPALPAVRSPVPWVTRSPPASQRGRRALSYLL